MKQHHTPKFYLRGFSSDAEGGHVWVYEKAREPVERSINLTGMETDLYAFTDEHGQMDNESVESVLQRIDSAGALALRKVLNDDPLSDSERRHLCQFISVMLRRTPRHKDEVEQRAAEMMPEFFEQHDERWLAGVVAEHLGTGPEARRHFEKQRAELQRIREAHLEKTPDFFFANEATRPSVVEEVVYHMDWGLFMSRPGVDFVTCDNPVVYSRGTGLRDWERGLVIFPLSPKLCLQAMWRTSYRGQREQLSSRQVRLINRYVVQNVHEQVYAAEHSSRLAAFVDKWLGTGFGPPAE